MEGNSGNSVDNSLLGSGYFAGLRLKIEKEYLWSGEPVIHILVKEKALADELRNRRKSGAKFGDLAKEFSTCPSKSNSGDLGWFGPGKMVKPFEEAVKRLSHGSLSPEVKTQFGYHIIKKTGQKE